MLGRLFARLFPKPPALTAVEDHTGKPLSFDDVCTTFFPGLGNVAAPRVGDVIIVADSCGIGVSIRSEKRVRVTGCKSKNVYNGSRDGGNYMFVTTDDGDYPLQDIRRSSMHSRFWLYIR